MAFADCIDETVTCLQVPSQLMERCHLTYIEQGDPVSLEELGAKLCGHSETKTYSAYIEACIQGLLKVYTQLVVVTFDLRAYASYETTTTPV